MKMERVLNRRKILKLSLASTMASAVGFPAVSAEQLHPVSMWTEGAKKFYDPAFLRANIGDVVQFVNITGNHNTESIRGMIPKGAAPWNSELNETFELRVTHEGVYGYKCTPHYTKAMVGLIVVGERLENLDQAIAVKHPKEAREEFQRLFAQV